MPGNFILNTALQCMAGTHGAHSFPESGQIRGVRLATEPAGQRYLKRGIALWIFLSQVSYVTSLHELRLLAFK